LSFRAKRSEVEVEDTWIGESLFNVSKEGFLDSALASLEMTADVLMELSANKFLNVVPIPDNVLSFGLNSEEVKKL
jgi:hypothetical protein